MKLRKKYHVYLLGLFLVFLLAVTGADVRKVFAEDNVPSVKENKKTLYTDYEDYQIELDNVLPEAKVTYKSSNSKVALVDSNGVVKPVSKGTATITVTVKQNKKTYTLKVKITVSKPYIFITNKVSELEEGDKYSFEVKTAGLKNPDIVWWVSDKSVASIKYSAGTLTAKKTGTVKVTAMDRTNKKYSVCYVTVKEKTEPFGISDDISEIWCGVDYKLNAGGGRVSEENILWSVSDESIASIDENGILTAYKIGEVTVTASDKESSKKASVTLKTKDIEETPAEAFDIGISDDNSYAYIRGIKDKSYTEIKIPEEINGLPIVSIKDFSLCGQEQIKTVIIPASIEYIGDVAFMNCTNIETVVFLNRPEDRMLCTGRDLFSYNYNLKEFITPYYSHILLGTGAFIDTGIESITFPRGGYYVVANRMFKGCSKLRNVIIPDTVTTIGMRVFCDCENLRVVIPETVVKINEYAFYECTNVTIVTPKGSYAEKYAKKHNINYENY